MTAPGPMTHHASARAKRRLAVLLPFVAIAAVFAFIDVLAMRRVVALRGETEQIVANMLQSIGLVSEMRYDLDQLQILADRHIFEKEGASMAALEQSMTAAEADYAAAARAYAPLVTLPDEMATWARFKERFVRLMPPLDAAIERSRVNDDLAAERALIALDPQFDAAHRDSVQLIEINREGADQAVARAALLQQASSTMLQALALIGIGATLVVAIGVARFRERRERLLAHYSGELEQKNRELDAFAGRVAHDLRGPLSTATFAASRLASIAPEQTKTADILLRSFTRMDAIIGDLLVLARMPERSGSCNPAAAAEQLRDDLALRADGEGVSLVIDVKPAQVRCCEGLLRQVVWNLADNAMKYRRLDVDARVEILGHPAGAEYELSVRDNGVGMSPEDARRVFEPFYRAGSATGVAGTGLGLSIVKRVVELNGGHISVASEAGRGTSFVTMLPLVADAPAAGPVRP